MTIIVRVWTFKWLTLLWNSNISNSFITFGCSIVACTLSSLGRNFSRKSFGVFLLSIIFTATRFCVFSLYALFTFAYDPSPKHVPRVKPRFFSSISSSVIDIMRLRLRTRHFVKQKGASLSAIRNRSDDVTSEILCLAFVSKTAIVTRAHFLYIYRKTWKQYKRGTVNASK